jgi:hypothetical protein
MILELNFGTPGAVVSDASSHACCPLAGRQRRGPAAVDARVVALQRIDIAAPIGCRWFRIARRPAPGASVPEMDVGMKIRRIPDSLRSTNGGLGIFQCRTEI